ncbi:MAG: TrkH family potassium uptake protein [Gammaproteobacteria bacterium]
MHKTIVLKVLGALLMLYSLTMLPPIFCAFAITLTTGLLFWLPVHHHKEELRTRDGFIIVVMFWTVLGLSGATPFMLSQEPHMSLSDAIFESISGLTTTGATVLTHIDTLPKSILYYRQQLQWLGGMGIIVLAVAVLPMLGIGGMQLYRAETPGPIKDSKLTPRITETAKTLWYIYVTLTFACGLSYWLAGMSVFDAIGHAFATVAIGGFSTHDASIGYFNSPSIDFTCIFFMLLSGINFALHFLCWSNKSIAHYFRDPEVKCYLFFIFIITSISFYTLVHSGILNDTSTAFREALFHTVSITTTTGFATDNFANWPTLVAVVLIMGSFLGGCAGSTCGGIKAIRILLMYKQGLREVKRLIYPSATVTVKLGGKPVDDRVIEAVSGFVGAYIALYAILLLVVLATGMDFETGFSAVAASLNNLGPGLGSVASHYGDTTNPTKWVLCVAMLLGRLEIFTVLVLFTPTFWQK